MTSHEPQINYDQPLASGSALASDTLYRRGFAETATSAIRRVSTTNGFVLSIEGAWGSGKTSILAMIEELLDQTGTNQRPVIVHFNPWLVGNRDALLRQFLSRIAGAIELSDMAKDGQKVAQELTAYSKTFDVLKLIPGAEPWASIVKSVIEAVGGATGAIAEHKVPNLEQEKRRAEDALREFPKPIVVFIDDIDRLFPLEVFEMIRIIKAVGGLPNIGYVLAWDPAYVSGALSSLNVPQADTYLDKIVQVRMPIPNLSMSARRRLINDALGTLDPEASKPRFKGDETRLSHLYFSGLRELLDQPRDVIRVFNTVRVIEPSLRGEVVFADIVGLAALMVKATPVFDLLRKAPNYFVGSLHDESFWPEKSEKSVKDGTKSRSIAYQACPSPAHARRVVHYLFPIVAKEEGSFEAYRVSDVDGHLAHPTRLLVALQLTISPADVSIESVRRYLQHPDQRADIVKVLTSENCLEFLELMGDVAQNLEGEGITDLEELSLSIAKLADTEPFPSRYHNRSDVFSLRPDNAAVRAISFLVKATDHKAAAGIAQKLVESGDALTVAANVVVDSYLTKRERDLVAPESAKADALERFSQNVLQASKSKNFFDLADPGYVLWVLARTQTPAREVFETLRMSDPTLDAFATHFFKHSFDSTKGQTFSLPDEMDRLTAFCSLEELQAHAAERLTDKNLSFPARAAWMAVVQGKKVYAVDGSPADR